MANLNKRTKIFIGLFAFMLVLSTILSYAINGRMLHISTLSLQSIIFIIAFSKLNKDE